MPFDLASLFGPFQEVFNTFFGFFTQILQAIFGGLGVQLPA
jgi:hypothetical protein